MSSVAFEDRKRDKKILANEAFSKYGKTDKKYFCSNKCCSAEMILKSRNGEKTHYFSATKNYPHIKSCIFYKYNFEIEQFNESEFSLERLFSESCIDSENKKSYLYQDIKSDKTKTNHEKRIKTVSELYSMCITLGVDEKYNGLDIWKILVDEQSEYIYKNGIYDGVRLIKCQYIRYERDACLIYLNSCNRFDLKIHICDRLFPSINNDMYKLKSNNGYVLVLGNWHKIGKYYFAEITSKKQYKILG